ncbi:BLUF domain-containing protein [Bizionia sp. KMM 8389]
MNNLYQLNYYSKTEKEIDIATLNNILETAIAVNTTKNISGCLIYHNKSFVQILEGDKKTVQEIYKKIKADRRHHSVTVLWENIAQTRCFPNWSMAYHKPENENIKQYVNNLLLLSELSDTSSASLLSFWSTVRNLLRNNSINQASII